MASAQFPSDKRRNSVSVTGNKTLAVADQGIVQTVNTDALTITLPAAGAAATGTKFVIQNGGQAVTNGPVGTGSNQSVGITIATSASDTVTGLGFTPAANKGPQNLKATANVGDEISLVSGVNNWNIVEAVGTWTRLP